jgi:hypothetical protein
VSPRGWGPPPPEIGISASAGTERGGKRRAKRSRKVPDGPSLQKRSPASPASENGANRKSKSSQKQITKVAPKSQASERHFFWVTDGQITAGYVERADNQFEAFTADGHRLGIYSTLKAASKAIPVAHGGDHG